MLLSKINYDFTSWLLIRSGTDLISLWIVKTILKRNSLGKFFLVFSQS